MACLWCFPFIRTPRRTCAISTASRQLNYVDPLGYLEFNYLLKHARGVTTDSGDITEETTVLGIPCMTLRYSTERPETITIGTNELIGTDPRKLPPVLARLMAGQWKKARSLRNGTARQQNGSLKISNDAAAQINDSSKIVVQARRNS